MKPPSAITSTMPSKPAKLKVIWLQMSAILPCSTSSRPTTRRYRLQTWLHEFNLTEPYISKYIKEKSGKTFGELVTNAKMKKARTLLRNSITTVENIAIEAGYQNVEHFNRQFKKLYGMTPLEYRNSSTK